MALISGLLILTLITLTGCKDSNLTNEPKEDLANTFVSMEEDPVLEYQVPDSYPHILVNQLGYEPEGSKQAFFFGAEVPDAFRVVDEETGRVVFSGTLEERPDNGNSNDKLCIGDFSKLKDEGQYHIEANLLGASYQFQIRSDIYKDVFAEACKTYYYNRCGITLTEALAKDKAHNACHTYKSVLREDMKVNIDVSGGWHQDATGSKDIVRASGVLGRLLLSYEFFPKAFGDDMNIPESGNSVPDILDEARYEIEWFLKMQDSSTGAVYSAVTVAESADSSTVSYIEKASEEATLAFAFALAKFSYLYQKYDREYATACLQAADRAWKYCILNSSEDNMGWKLAAAAEIYRASGKEDCYTYLLGRFSREPDAVEFGDGSFFGVVTFLNTKQEVDKDICEGLIKRLMKKAETVSQESRRATLFVPHDANQLNNSELLDSMTYLCLADYVVTNHEYDTIIENYLHYFLGRNKLSITYLDGVGTCSYMEIDSSLGIMKQFDEVAKLVFMLAKICENT